MEAPPSMLTWNAAWFINLAGIMQGAIEVRAMAPTVAVLTLGKGLAVFDVVIVAVTPCIVESVIAGAIGLGVIEVVAGMVDLVVSHVGKGGHAVDDSGGNVVVGVGIYESFDAFKVLLCNVF
jgi:hypothetical protein